MLRFHKYRCFLFLLLTGLILSGCGKAPAEPAEPESTKAPYVSETVEEKKETTPAETVTETAEPETDPEETWPEEQPDWIAELDHNVTGKNHEAYLSEHPYIMEYYKTAMEAIFAHEEVVILSDSYDDNLFVMYLIRENPYAFVLEEYDLKRDHKTMYMEYKYSAEECAEKLSFIDREYLSILNRIIYPEMSEVEKVLAVYKYFAEHISYDYAWAEALDMTEDKFLFPDIAVYQALETGYGVCHTYSYLCQFAFQQLGISCVRASADMAYNDDSHMWLIVWIDGAAYHIDPTWDSGTQGASLRYFGMTDEECLDRGVVYNWPSGIDMSLDIHCDDSRFADWRDIVYYELRVPGYMDAWRDGENEPERISLSTAQG